MRLFPIVPLTAVTFIRVIDDSGEDYLYPYSLLVPIHPSSSLRAALQRKKTPGV